MRRQVNLLAAVAAVAIAAATAAPSASAATPGCTLASTGGTVKRTLGAQSYRLHVPAGLTGGEVPLLLSVHGFGGNGQVQELFTGWSGFADSHNFIVAYPNGRPDLGFGAWDPYTPGSTDIAFLRHVVEDISAHWCIDEHRVHIDGWSNGAVMSQRMACNAADIFASATSYGGGTPTLGGFYTKCTPSRPISVALFAGQFDFTWLGLGLNAKEWRGYDGCSPTPVHTTDAYGITDRYSCAAGTQVLARTVKGTSHNWPFGAQAADQRNRMWAFFEANPLP